MSEHSSLEAELRLHGRIIYTNVGDSMMPLIKEGRDVLVIERCEGRLSKYDIPLYRRSSGQYVLHRIIKVREDSYDICGDNRACVERGVTDAQILGKLTGVIREGRELSFDTLQYKLYTHLWCDLFFIRAFLIKLRSYAKRILRGKKNKNTTGKTENGK